MNLYQITQDQSSIIELLEENGGEATEEVLNALQITREAFEKKAEGYAHLIIKLDGEVDIIASEIKRLQALKKTKENSVSRLKESLTNAMLVFGEQDDKGIRRYKTPTLSLSTRKSESVSIDDEKAILSRYIITKHEVSKSLISEALKSGIEVDGASLKINYSVQIR
jgi:hypothetical protein